MLEALDHWLLNPVLLGKGNTASAESRWEQLRAGAAEFGLHQDWGTTPTAIDACLTVADKVGVQVNLYPDTPARRAGPAARRTGACPVRLLSASPDQAVGNR